MNEKIRAALLAQAEEKYCAFSSGLLPGVSGILGVRLPVLQKMADKLAAGDWKTYLDGASDESFEEIMLQGMTLAKAKADLAEKIPYVERFIPKIDNWSVCDSFCAAFKGARKQEKEALALIDRHLVSEEPYAARFAVVMLLDHFMDEAHLDASLLRLTRVRAQADASQTAVAWALSAAYKKEREKTLDFMDAHDFPPDTKRRAYQKMIELTGVTEEEKERLRKLRGLCKK